VAVKILRLSNFPSETDRSTARKLFLQEARLTGRLNHPHITTIHDMGIHDDKPFLVMEYIKGRNLKEIIARNSDYSFKEKIGILSVLARAFHYAHQRGVLHRDIKPANIMLQENGTPKIMDFGIAGIIDKSSGKSIKSAADQDVSIFGTPHYMSPEHIRGENYDVRSEIFSLGILAYEWLSGQKPFVGKTGKELLRKIVKGDFTPLAKATQLDQKLGAIIDKALAAKQSERYRNMENFADELELYLNGLEMENGVVLPAYFSYDKSQIIARLREKYVFFSDFTEDELQTIFKLSQKKKYIPGEYIIREGTIGTKMFVIISGTVSVQNDRNGQEIEIQRLGPGSCVGEMSLVDKMERSASVVAVEPTLAIAINETVLRLSNPAICLKLYRNLAAMLSEKLRVNDCKYRELLAKSP
jgi:serine/threonine-protein kinase